MAQRIQVTYFRLFILLSLIVFAPFFAHAEPRVVELTAREGRGHEQLIIGMSQPVNYRVFTLSNPDRMVIDIPGSEWATVSGIPKGYRGTLIKNIRFGRFDPTTSRIVLDLGAAVTVDKSYTTPANGNTPFRLVFDLSSSQAQTALGTTEQTQSSSTEVIPSPRAKPTELATQYEKPVIVIDPGHGGQDPGARGGAGTIEKNLTLQYGLALRDALMKTGKYRVLMTRDDDRFILLRGRVDIARQARADLFISIHADSAPTGLAKGLSVYTLSETASDKEAAALAERENQADVVAGMDLSAESHDVANILIDLARRDTKNRSSVFADTLVDKIGRNVTLLPNTHRFAGFVVLKTLDIPSVLIEIGFLSHPEEEKNLLSRSHRDKTIRGIVSGVDHFFEHYSE